MKKFVTESWLVLVLGFAFAVLLAGAQTTLSPRIQENLSRALSEAIGEVVPGAVRTEKFAAAGYARDVFRCFDADGRCVGWAIDAVGIGFADKIRLVAGLSADGTHVTGLKVIENVETPGLGNKIAEDDPQAADDFPDGFRDANATRPLTIKKGGADRSKNEVQAITGATISSKAVTDIVNDALTRVRPSLGTQAERGARE